VSRVLVTGATGTVGAGLVEELLDGDAVVRVASRSPAGAGERFGDAPEYVTFEFGHPETWGPALDGVDRLFLLFPPAVGVGPVREFVDAAARVGVESVVLLSVLGAEKVPVLPHRRLERHLQAADLTATFLRAAYFAQNLAEVHRPDITARDELFVPAGDGALGVVDARDVSAVAARLLTGEQGGPGRGSIADSAGSSALDLTGPAALDFHEVAAVFSEVLGRDVTYADPSRREFARRMYRRGHPASFVAFMLAEYEVARWGLASRTTGAVERVLGRSPRSLRTFVADYRDRFE
jgi:uncharacterized protein YbjT (DUF2867 family)